MNRHRMLSPLTAPAAFALLLFAAWFCTSGGGRSVAEPQGDAAGQQDAAKSAPADLGALAGQVKELQKQVADMQARAGAGTAPRIIAAGTATWRRPETINNKTMTRVKLDPAVAAKLGTDYIVLLANRYPTGGYPFLVAYWLPAKDGFDVLLVDTSIDGEGETASYPNPNTTYQIDWAVVKK